MSTKQKQRWFLPALICLHADLSLKLFLLLHNTVALKILSGKINSKTNLTLLPEFDCCAGEPGDKASWLVVHEAELSAGPYLELVPYNQHF